MPDHGDRRLTPNLAAVPLDRVDTHRTAKRLARRLDALGYDVMLRPKVTA
jgi:hypothetical protein